MDPLISGLTSLFWFLIVLTVVVFIHEFGHYIVARWNGVKVEIFSIGFGSELFGWNDSHGTRWKVSAIPLGGYVKMYGDSDPASSPDFEKLKKLSSKDKAHSFYYKSLWQKSAIVFAGPAANYILAIVILSVMFHTYGKVYVIPEITAVVENSPAEKVGMQEGDLIIRLNGHDVDAFDDIKQELALNTGDAVELTIIRKSQEIDLIIVPEVKITKDVFGNEVKIPMLGISSNKVESQILSLSEAMGEAVRTSYTISVGMLRAVGQMIIGARSTDDLGGPIKIAKYSGQSAEAGINGVLWFIALISINLGLVNLFPIPMLDGGHLMYYAIEAIKGKPMNEKIQMAGIRVGMAALLTLMVYVTIKDVISLF